MYKTFWHAVLAAAILLFPVTTTMAASSDEAITAASEILLIAPQNVERRPVPIIVAQARARTKRDVEREKAKKLAKQKAAAKRKTRARRTKPRVKAVNAPLPVRKPDEADHVVGSGISLSAALITGGKPLAEGVVWTIEAMQGNEPPVVTNESLPTLNLPAGHYRVTAKLDNFLQSAEVDIPDKKVAKLDLAFNAARLRIIAIPSEGSMPLQDARIRILKIGVEGAPPIVDIQTAEFDDVIPAGIYRVEASHGLARISQDIGLTAGANRKVELNLSVGYVRLRARPGLGREPLSDVVFELLPADGLEANPDPLATMSGPSAVFTLPAGTYRAVARYGEASTRQLVDIAANAFSDVIMDLEAGRSIVTLTNLATNAGASFRLVRLDGDDGPSLVLSRRGKKLDVGLSAGSYKVEAEAHDGRTAAGAFIVEPGARALVELSLPPRPHAQVNLTASMSGGAALPVSDVTFDIQSTAGADTTSPTLAAPDHPVSLRPGAYEITARHGPTGASAVRSAMLTSGSETRLHFELPLGIAALTLADGTSSDRVAWLITGIDGKEVARLETASATLALKPGEYVLALTAEAKVHTAVVSISEGKTTAVTLPEK